MKKALFIAASLFLVSFSTLMMYNYNENATLTGMVTEVKYEMPPGDWYTTYILILDNKINVNANDEWDAKSNVDEVYLNIMNDQIEQYKNKIVSVTGNLFGALNIHHRRAVCIKVDKIEEE
jgi:hypothetical protein